MSLVVPLLLAGLGLVSTFLAGDAAYRADYGRTTWAVPAAYGVVAVVLLVAAVLVAW